MRLPFRLALACKELLSGIPYKELEQSAEELSSLYRAQSKGEKPKKAFMQTFKHKLAYLALRFPATYAAIFQALRQINEPIDSLLDIGSGPGTVLFAADELFPSLKKTTLVENDKELVRLGKTLFQSSGIRISPEYILQDMRTFYPEQTYDLVSAAYSLGELSEREREKVVKTLWDATNLYFFIIEPGTPYGFRVIERVRAFLISEGAFIAAPCTHEKECPLAKGNDWCHFSVRLEREELQRLVKGATLGYEDEKYSYLIGSKKPLQRATARIVKTPEKRFRHLRLTLCSSLGLTEKVISEKEKELYRSGKKLKWGDPYEANQILPSTRK